MNKKEKVLSNIKESCNEKYKSDFSPRQENQQDFFKQKNSTKKFLLSINETIIGATKIGYIFKFETPKHKLTKNYSILSSTLVAQKVARSKNEYSENEKSDNSDISFVHIPKHPSQKILFNKTENNSGIDLGLDITFIPKISKKSEFYLDAVIMSYKQKFNKDKNDYKISDSILREQAEEKVLKLKQKKILELEEEEEEEGSDTSSDSEENGLFSSEKSSSISSKNLEKKLILKNESDLQDASPMAKNTNENINFGPRNSLKHSSFIRAQKANNNTIRFTQSKIPSNDYYHINADHITLFVYNYSTGFVEALKDSKFKISQMTTQMEMNKERIGKSNSKFIANPKLAQKEKKKLLIDSLKKSAANEHEINDFNEKKIKLIEIGKILK